MNANLLDELDKGPQERPFEVWGQVSMDTFEAILTKGIGKKPFDPMTDDPNKKVIAIKLEVTPLPEMGTVFSVSRDMINQSKDWGLTLNSFKALGLKTGDLIGKYVKASTVPTGETFTNKNGETKDKTYIKFLAVFPDLATCAADFKVNGTPRNNTANTSQVGGTYSTEAAPTSTPANGNGNGHSGNGNGNGIDLVKLLKPMAINATRGISDYDQAMQKMGALLSSMPQFAGRFTVQSPEVINAVIEALAG